ncbi:hypothetical protein ACGFYP_02035 [Streptomyces sp. NPDC048370]|uniref:hypothetical protein n=1 Tax=Streptomyces sp. NPDC048370 TaxID=3365540 RepID=UPI003712774B
MTLLLAASVGGFVLVRGEQRDRDNQDVLARACEGALPRADAAELLADDSSWTLRTGPGPRGLVSCTVGGSGDDEPGFTVTAEPILDPPLKSVRVEHVLYPSPYEEAPDWAGEHKRADELVTVPCANGLPGYPRPVTSFRVYASAYDPTDHVADDAARERLGALVAALAEDVRATRRCGGVPVRETDVRPVSPSRPKEDTDASPAECAWFRPALLGPAAKGAEQSADGATHAWARACSVSFRKPGSVVTVSSASWWGEVLPEVRTEYGSELARVGHGSSPDARPDTRPETRRKVPSLVVWAESRCAGGRTLHRVDLTGADRELLLARTDSLLTHYLDASGDCDDTKVLGKVWR